MKNLSIRVSDNTIKSAEKIYGTKVTGCQIAVEGYFEIQKRTVSELKGKFTPEELSAIVDNLNGVMIQSQFKANTEVLWHHLLDGDEYDGLFSKWGIDSAEFKGKVLSLTSAQAYFLQDCAQNFWGKDPAILKDFINTFI